MSQLVYFMNRETTVNLSLRFFDWKAHPPASKLIALHLKQAPTIFWVGDMHGTSCANMPEICEVVKGTLKLIKHNAMFAWCPLVTRIVLVQILGQRH